MPENAIFSRRTSETSEALFDPFNKLWGKCGAGAIDRSWGGRSALREKGHNWMNLTYVRSLWNEQTVFFTLNPGLIPSMLTLNGAWRLQLKVFGTRMWWKFF